MTAQPNTKAIGREHLQEFIDKICGGRPELIAQAENAFYYFNKVLAERAAIRPISEQSSIDTPEFQEKLQHMLSCPSMMFFASRQQLVEYLDARIAAAREEVAAHQQRHIEQLKSKIAGLESLLDVTTTQRIKERFAVRPKSPATADFDFPASSNSDAPQQASTAQAEPAHAKHCNLRFPATLNTGDDFCSCGLTGNTEPNFHPDGLVGEWKDAASATGAWQIRPTFQSNRKTDSIIAELRAYVSELQAEVQEWLCADCNMLYPRAPQPGVYCVACPKCGGLTGPRATVELRAARKSVLELRAALAAAQAVPAKAEPVMYVHQRTFDVPSAGDLVHGYRTPSEDWNIPLYLHPAPLEPAK